MTCPQLRSDTNRIFTETADKEWAQPHLSNLLLGVLEIAKGVLHPVLVIALGKVLPRVRPAGLLPPLSAVHGDGRIDQQVFQLQCLRHTCMTVREAGAGTTEWWQSLTASTVMVMC